jgi:putative MATE family efflux protein
MKGLMYKMEDIPKKMNKGVNSEINLEAIESREENKMGSMPVNRLLVSMSVPMMISMLVQALYNVVDSVFVAQISENALTAVSLAFPIQVLMIALGVGTGVGVNAFLSRSLGEKNYGDVNKTATNAIFLCWASYIIFLFLGIFAVEPFFRSQTEVEAIVGYGKEYLSVICICSFGLFNQIMLERLLTSTGKTMYSMISQAAGAITNLILDPIMIFGLLGCPKMGVTGAAAATVIGQILGAAVALFLNVRGNSEIKISFRGFRPDFYIIKNIYKIGLPAIIMQAIGSFMTYGFNQILISFTETAAAVFGAYFKLQSFIFMPVFGLNNGMVPIIAYNFGARKRERITKTIKLSLCYAFVFMIAGIALFNFIPDKLLGFFNASDEMLGIGVTALRIISVHYIFAGFSIVLISVFQALGSGFASLIISVARQLVVLLPAAWLLSLSGRLANVWWSFPMAEVMSLGLCLFFIKRLYDSKIKNL